MSADYFLSPEEFYSKLITDRPVKEAALYGSMRHTRIEPGYKNRKFIVYKMNGKHAEKLATLAILDFVCDDEEGSTMQLQWMEHPDKVLLVGYYPTQVFDFPLFIHLPVNNKLRWSARTGKSKEPSLSFLMVIRSQSRQSLRDKNTIYMEANKSFQKEFFLTQAI